MTLEKLNRIEELKSGAILTSESTDAVIIVKNSVDFHYCVVEDCDYSEEHQDYVPDGKDYYLTYNDIAKRFAL